MGQAAAADVRARFSADAVVPRYEAFYEEVLARGRTGPAGDHVVIGT
jgi:hypothetical protein